MLKTSSKSIPWAKRLFAILSIGCVAWATIIYCVVGEMNFMMNRTTAVLFVLFILHERYSKQPVIRHWGTVFYWLAAMMMIVGTLVNMA